MAYLAVLQHVMYVFSIIMVKNHTKERVSITHALGWWCSKSGLGFRGVVL